MDRWVTPELWLRIQRLVYTGSMARTLALDYTLLMARTRNLGCMGAMARTLRLVYTLPMARTKQMGYTLCLATSFLRQLFRNLVNMRFQ